MLKAQWTVIAWMEMKLMSPDMSSAVLEELKHEQL